MFDCQRLVCPPAVLLVALLLVPASGLADDRYADGRPALERSNWWPFASGPHYGEVPSDSLRDARTLRLPVGSFDTRGPGLSVPTALRLTLDETRAARSPWLVQVAGPVTPALRTSLLERGLTIYRFFPSNTLLARADNPEALSGDGVLWAGPYHPAYRIEPTLGKAPTADELTARNERIYVRVHLFEPGEKQAVVEALIALGADIDTVATAGRHDAARVYFTATPGTIVEAAALNEVLWIEEVSRTGFALNAETKVVMQSGFVDGGTPLWDAGVEGGTQLVAVMDSGLDVDTILVSDTSTDAGTPGSGHRKVQSYTGWSDPPDLRTCSGRFNTYGYSHGTNSTQCAVGNRSDFGMSDNVDGIARSARVAFQDVGPSDDICCFIGCLDVPSQLAPLYDEVRGHGGHLTNGSFAICSYGTYGSHAFDVDEYAWNNRDFLGFFSGGNGGAGNACPGTNKNNISSGGHYQDPFQNEFYGSYGPSPDGRMGPTVLGPACDHGGGNPAPFDFNTSTSIQSTDQDITGPPTGDAGINQGSCGTSFSSPYLMGAGALIRDYFEQGFYPSGTPSAGDAFAPSGALVKAALINSGDFVDSCVGCVNPGLMGSMGMGRVNLSNTLSVACDGRTAPGIRVVDKGMDVGLATGGSFELPVDVFDTSVELRATVVWVDRPGSTLTNDLRLTVTGPDGTPAQTFFGNNFPASATAEYSTSEAAGGTANDGANVFEAVRIDPAALVAGTWTIRVEGSSVPMGDPAYGNTQPFALIASGGLDPPAGEVSPPGSGTPLRAEGNTGGDITWQWDAVAGCSFSFYRGTLAALSGGTYDHQMIDASQCGLTTGTTTVGDGGDGTDAYYLVAARKSGGDGTLGFDSAGGERPPANPTCP